MTAEYDVLVGLSDQLARIETGIAEAHAMMGSAPVLLSDLDAASPNVRVASTALVKNFEQFCDTLSRLMRTLFKTLGYSVKGMTPFDVANKSEELGLVENAVQWHELVKLRNELAHEYPDNAAVRFNRLSRALTGFEFLFDAAARVRTFISTQNIGAGFMTCPRPCFDAILSEATSQ